ncbi:XRE family transcriptional regulator [Vreelandella sp. SM1641]|uniref:XRE family transcriptional regulator n=1 Tax=Vreelandella sp. SM1641 TaxID=3126101 RepID=UPI0035B5269A
MSTATTIGERLRQLMEEQEIGENELARRSKVPQPTIHRILKGVSNSPRISNLEKLAASLGTTASFLAHGGGNRGLFGSSDTGMPGVGIGTGVSSLTGSARHDRASPPPCFWSYPILTWSEAMQANRLDAHAPGEKNQFESCDYLKIGVAFWLKMCGDAMAAPIGASPSLPEGTLVLLDTGLQAMPGKLVLVELPDSPKPTLRMLIEESGRRYLKPLNPAYPLISLDNNCHILAVAIEARIKL